MLVDYYFKSTFNTDRLYHTAKIGKGPKTNKHSRNIKMQNKPIKRVFLNLITVKTVYSTY